MSGKLDADQLAEIRAGRGTRIMRWTDEDTGESGTSVVITGREDVDALLGHIDALQAELDYANEQVEAWVKLTIRHDGEMYEAGTRHAIQEYVGQQLGLQQAVSGEWVDVDDLQAKNEALQDRIVELDAAITAYMLGHIDGGEVSRVQHRQWFPLGGDS